MNNATGSWGGNFFPGEFVIWTIFANSLQLNFSQGLSEVGAQIQPNGYGSFSAQLQAFSGTTLLGTVTETGNATLNNDGSAIFIGSMDSSTANITSVVFSVGGNDFAIGTLT